jgi:hypothetical protein
MEKKMFNFLLRPRIDSLLTVESPKDAAIGKVELTKCNHPRKTEFKILDNVSPIAFPGQITGSL